MRAAAALARRAGGQALLERIAVAFATAAEERVAGMRAAAASGDAATLERLAHALKGSAAQLGAHDLRDAAAALEHAAAAGSESDPGARVGVVAASLVRARAWLDVVVREGR